MLFVLPFERTIILLTFKIETLSLSLSLLYIYWALAPLSKLALTHSLSLSPSFINPNLLASNS